MDPRLWTPRYVIDRISGAMNRRLHPDWPWLTAAAVRFLDQYLRPGDVGLEWGAGRSTLWLAKRVQRLTTVEHNTQWYEKVRARLQKAKTPNVDLHLAELDGGAASPYIRATHRIPAGTLDFVLVDGELRHFATETAMKLLRLGGLLILDNANWYLASTSRAPKTVRATLQEWRDIESELSRWRRLSTTNGVWDTVLWFKPLDSSS